MLAKMKSRLKMLFPNGFRFPETAGDRVRLLLEALSFRIRMRVQNLGRLLLERFLHKPGLVLNSVEIALGLLLFAAGLNFLETPVSPKALLFLLLALLLLSYRRFLTFFLRATNQNISPLDQNIERLFTNRKILANQIDDLAAMREVALAVSSILDFNEMIRSILTLMTDHFGVQKALLYIADTEETELKVVGARIFRKDVPIERVLQKKFPFGTGLVGEAAEQRRERTDCRPDRGIAAAIPLIAKSRVIGVLKLSDPDPEILSEEEFRRLRTISASLAVALENARLYKLAVTDGLTGLFVHRHFQHRLQDEFVRSRRYGTPLALLLTDIDHFKKFNDTHGHRTGDAVLRQIAKLLQREARESDIVCRYGGEEMAIICPETRLSGARQLAERIRSAADRTTFRDADGKPGLHVTLSIGLATTFTPGVHDRYRLIEEADAALYEAKKAGRNRVVAAPEIQAAPA
ncbi:MAG: sensor domain-containing diguanylate cyclase [Candidatus Hydrogenedentota bacterium]|nr:MAG: sensor domain-containing diguanylate cyclase [Candidatus Hydrogenedentota bacterium]